METVKGHKTNGLIKPIPIDTLKIASAKSILAHLTRTELDYVHSVLRVLKFDFKAYLVALAKQKQINTEENAIAEAFSNIDDLCDLHQDLLDSFMEIFVSCNSDLETQRSVIRKWQEIYLQFAHYDKYIDSYKDSIQKFLKMVRKDDRLFQALGINEVLFNGSLEEFMFAPLERLPQYALYIALFYETLPESEGVVKRSLGNSVKEMVELLDNAVTKWKFRERKEEILEIQESFDPAVDFVIPDRFVVLAERLRRFKPSSKVVKTKYCYVILFNDRFIVGLFDMGGKKCRLKCDVSLKDLKCKRGTFGDTGFAFKVTHPDLGDKEIVLLTDSHEDLGRWTDAITQAVEKSQAQESPKKDTKPALMHVLSRPDVEPEPKPRARHHSRARSMLSVATLEAEVSDVLSLAKTACSRYRALIQRDLASPVDVF